MVYGVLVICRLYPGKSLIASLGTAETVEKRDGLRR